MRGKNINYKLKLIMFMNKYRRVRSDWSKLVIIIQLRRIFLVSIMVKLSLISNKNNYKLSINMLNIASKWSIGKINLQITQNNKNIILC